MLALLLIYNGIFSPSFYHLEMANGHLVGNTINVLHYGSKVMLIALGMTLVIATGGIDLSVGAMMAIAGGVSALLISDEECPDWCDAGPVRYGRRSRRDWERACLRGCGTAYVIGYVEYPADRGDADADDFGRGVADLITGGFKPTYLEDANPHLNFIGHGFLLGIPFPLYIVGIFTVVTLLFTRATAMGLYIESIGNNPAAASLAGIQAKFVKFSVYAFTGVCAAVAGLVQTTDVHKRTAYNEGLYMELDAIVAVAHRGARRWWGGGFRYCGSLLGALIAMQTLTVTISVERDQCAI